MSDKKSSSAIPMGLVKQPAAKEFWKLTPETDQAVIPKNF
jgi:hypothetical protein